MKRTIRAVVLALAITAATLSTSAPVAAQDGIDESLSLLAEDNARLYLQPVFEGLGYALNSGFAEDASVHPFLGFDLGVRVMGAFVPEELETFTADLSQTVTYEGQSYQASEVLRPLNGTSLSTPTSVGTGDVLTLTPDGDYRQALIANGENPNDYNVPFPEGYDIPGVPFVVIQGGVGIGFNTEVTARFIPGTEVDEEVGEVEAYGFGASHQVSSWFPGSPIDVTVTGGFQDFKVGSYLDASTTSFGLTAGRGFGPLDLFVAARQVSPSVDVEYEVENPDDNPSLPPDGTVISLSPDIDSETRIGAGFNLHLMILNVAAEYTLGEYNVASLKAGISVR